MLIRKIIEIPSYVIRGLNRIGLLRWVDDEIYVSWRYKQVFGKSPNLEEPKNFNEKLLWLKLNERNPKYTQLVDKYEVRKYIGKSIGEHFLIPLVGIWDTVEDIEWENLPNEFVMKCTHDSGSLIICKDKSSFNINKAKSKLKKYLSKNYYYAGREWPYKNVKPRIIAEKYITDESSPELRDYRFFCFNGIPKFITVDININDKKNTKRNLYDIEWNLLEAEISYPHDKTLNIPKPKLLNEMIEIATTLAQDIPFSRIDLYYLDSINQIYFGEITFYHQGGLGVITPEEFSNEIGNLIKLPLN